MPTLAAAGKNLNSEIRFRVPSWLRKILEKRAARMNISLSEYARNVFLMVTGAFDEEIERVSKIKPAQKLTDEEINKTIKEIRAKRK
jgi:DNA-binding transcriptional regulator/RsmH inhibitor MraZ